MVVVKIYGLPGGSYNCVLANSAVCNTMARLGMRTTEDLAIFFIENQPRIIGLEEFILVEISNWCHPEIGVLKQEDEREKLKAAIADFCGKKVGNVEILFY